ncbi:hypothetical protein BU25DRAFT_411124 [Macroventuria anomochaeta]|uniref:Uncharacterized protein n=1 Tax=Macroventuria anomochaeta TaxID=301207 RepID=A0ACB6RYQ8_9PLEO|nr:uncharacterized protein BU25DRAFT_411124 [Macroventuria anomochaeta]KAF2627016.1 hypothetical protein BU25DRAFT_411124 [Macroventuria anomochaeta]
MAKLCMRRDALVSTLRELISQFVPEFFDHALIQRCWGSVETISKVLIKVREQNEEVQRKESDPNVPTIVHIVREVPSDGYLDFHQITQLSKPIAQCRSCRREERYPDVDDALAHLRQAHTKFRTETGAPANGQLAHWLVSSSVQGMERSNERLLEFVKVLQQCTRKLLSKAIEIRSSVTGKDNRKGNKYLLPTALVKAAEKIFQYIYYSAYSIEEWHKRGLAPAAPSTLPPLLADRTDVTGAEYFAKIADIAMSNARDELMLMTHTGESRDPVLHIRTTPESNVLVSLFCLMTRPILEGLEIDKLYREHLVRLRYEASRKPTKRILREVYLLKDEMEVVVSVVKQQKNTIRAFGEVLDSDSFRITNQVRIEAWRTLENPSVKGFLKTYDSALKKEIQALYKEADKLAESLRHNIAIAEEGNSKAILIFTLVTIVFLPLSFVSSVFGMNTVDVRDMASTQTLFWAVALPVTAVVGGLSLLAAYGGPSLQRHIQNLKKIKIEVQFFTFKRQRSDDEERPRLDHEEKTRQVRKSDGRRKRGFVEVTKREILLGRETNKQLPTRPTRNVTLGDMFFR